jgi:hypothetical protein
MMETPGRQLGCAMVGATTPCERGAWTLSSVIRSSEPCIPDLDQPTSRGCAYPSLTTAVVLDPDHRTVLFPSLPGPYAMMDQLVVRFVTST